MFAERLRRPRLRDNYGEGGGGAGSGEGEEREEERGLDNFSLEMIRFEKGNRFEDWGTADEALEGMERSGFDT